MTSLDAWLARRTFALFAVLMGLGVAIDRLAGIGASAGQASIGAAPLGPVLGAIAAAWTIADAKRSGALGALEAIGARPLRARTGAVVAGIAAGLVAAAIVGADRDAADRLFPTAPSALSWRVGDDRSNARFVAPASGVAIDASGALVVTARPLATAASPTSRAHLRFIGAASLSLSSVALCLLAALDRRSARLRVAIVLAFVAAQIVVFVGVGAGTLAPLVAMAPAIALAAIAAQLSSSG